MARSTDPDGSLSELRKLLQLVSHNDEVVEDIIAKEKTRRSQLPGYMFSSIEYDFCSNSVAYYRFSVEQASDSVAYELVHGRVRWVLGDGTTIEASEIIQNDYQSYLARMIVE